MKHSQKYVAPAEGVQGATKEEERRPLPKSIVNQMWNTMGSDSLDDDGDAAAAVGC